jgi:putative PIN family toxin of toxin-antitoxin system
MRVVIDTNVLVSGVMNPHGPPGRIVDRALAGAFTVLYDDRVMSEYREVLARPRFRFNPADINALLDFIEVTGEPVAGRQLPIVLPDSRDLPFLEVAAAGRADALITGNTKHFQPRRGQHEVTICTPAEFIRSWAQNERQD